MTAPSRHCPTATSRAGVNSGRTPEAKVGTTLQCDRNDNPAVAAFDGAAMAWPKGRDAETRVPIGAFPSDGAQSRRLNRLFYSRPHLRDRLVRSLTAGDQSRRPKYTVTTARHRSIPSPVIWRLICHAELKTIDGSKLDVRFGCLSIHPVRVVLSASSRQIPKASLFGRMSATSMARQKRPPRHERLLSSK